MVTVLHVGGVRRWTVAMAKDQGQGATVSPPRMNSRSMCNFSFPRMVKEHLTLAMFSFPTALLPVQCLLSLHYFTSLICSDINNVAMETLTVIGVDFTGL